MAHGWFNDIPGAWVNIASASTTPYDRLERAVLRRSFSSNRGQSWAIISEEIGSISYDRQHPNGISLITIHFL
jgi:hypothetical protein